MVDRHWQLNQQMTPHMANAPVNTILRAARPFIVGAKPVGAGGGGFLLLLTEDPDAAAALKAHLEQARLPGHVADYGIAASGLQIRTDAFP
jgi:galactokinase/mevalonate kinase-like predicted kinase